MVNSKNNIFVLKNVKCKNYFVLSLLKKNILIKQVNIYVKKCFYEFKIKKTKFIFNKNVSIPKNYLFSVFVRTFFHLLYFIYESKIKKNMFF